MQLKQVMEAPFPQKQGCLVELGLFFLNRRIRRHSTKHGLTLLPPPTTRLTTWVLPYLLPAAKGSEVESYHFIGIRYFHAKDEGKKDRFSVGCFFILNINTPFSSTSLS